MATDVVVYIYGLAKVYPATARGGSQEKGKAFWPGMPGRGMGKRPLVFARTSARVRSARGNQKVQRIPLAWHPAALKSAAASELGFQGDGQPCLGNLGRAYERQECFAWKKVESVANMTAFVSPVASLLPGGPRDGLHTEGFLSPALSPPAATARQRGEPEGERENPRQLAVVAHVSDSSVIPVN